MTLPAVDPRFWRHVADVLRGHEYTERNVITTLGASSAGTGVRRLGPPLYRTSAGRPVDTFIRLFVIGAHVDESRLAPLIAPSTVDAWCANGIVERVGDQVRAGLTIRAFGDILLAADVAGRPNDPLLADDYVMGMSPSTEGLARLTVRRPTGSTLDLASGGGYHALLAAAHSDRVVATDVNPRAVWMTRVNATMNGVERIEARQGDLFGPVEGETFDLIVSNPPFIVGPDISQQFLSTEREGDDLAREIAATAPRFLNEGGYCQFLTNWMSMEGQPWWERVGSWFDGSSCDVWVIRISSDVTDDYTAEWLSQITEGAEDFEPRFARWMASFEALGADGVGLGLITMRKRSGVSTWMRFNDVTDALSQGSGDDLHRLVGVETWINERDPDELLDTAFTVSPHTRLEQEMRWLGGQFEVSSMALSRAEGLRLGGSMDEGALELLSLLDGRRSLRAVLVDLLEDASDEALAEVAQMVTRLVGLGLVLPVIRG